MRARARVTFWAVLALGCAGPALAGERPTQTQAMAMVFPDAEIQRKELFLTDAQLAQVKALSGGEVRSKILVAYEARKGGELLGVALFDTHVVRTAQETAMVAISPVGAVLRVEVVQFREPEDYAAPARWTQQLVGQTLSPRLSLKADIKPLSGASLTAQSLVDASRRALAFFQVLHLAGEASLAPDAGAR
jgi:hypothetical protein